MPSLLDPNNPKHARAQERLRADLIAWLTTVSPEGRPQSTPVWFQWDGDAFLVYSRPRAAKLRNVAANPNVSLHLEGNRVGGDNVIFEGVAAHLPGAPPADRMAGYMEKYGPRIEQYGWTPASFAADYAEAIRITPTRARIW